MSKYGFKEFIYENGILDKNTQYLIHCASLNNIKKSLNINEIKNIFKIIDNMILNETNRSEGGKIIDDENVIPKHYTNMRIEPIVYIMNNNLNFAQGNIVKYLSRLGKKDDRIDELKKVYFYFDVLINGNYEKTKERFKRDVSTKSSE